jgi:hypothetical protein
LGAHLEAQTAAPANNPPAAYSLEPAAPAQAYANETIQYPDYNANELSVDLFGAGTTGHSHYDSFYGNYQWHHAHAGGGAGINYFISNYFGVGADFLAEDLNPFVYSASGNLIGRLPIGNSGFAPYLFAGGGYQFHEDRTGFGQAGLGLEFRFCHHLGIFVDGRGVFPDHRDYGFFRGGLRISF